MCNCTKYHPCTCNKQERPEYKIGQKWLTSKNNLLEILAIHKDNFWVMITHSCGLVLRDDYHRQSMDEVCVKLQPKTIKATVISYKYAKNRLKGLDNV